MDMLATTNNGVPKIRGLYPNVAAVLVAANIRPVSMPMHTATTRTARRFVFDIFC